MRLVSKGVSEPLVGELDIPVSKYHAHRALLLASLANGTSRIHGASNADHVRHTLTALRDLGTPVTIIGDTFEVCGGRYRPQRPNISVGSSGTTLYFLTGLASLAEAPVTITGQKYFRHRPIRPLLEALATIGVEVSSEAGRLPITVAARPPSGGHVRIPGTLSQWISSLLLVSPFATAPTVVEVVGEFNERSYVDLTVAMMRRFGLRVTAGVDGRRFEIEPGQRATAAEIHLPPDVGAAAFGLAAAALHPSDVMFCGLPSVRPDELDHPEADLLETLSAMGLPLLRDPDTGWVRVRHDGSRLDATRVDCRRVPDMLPVLSVLGAHARGTTVLENVAHVRLKESDRVAAMLQLARMGADVRLDGDRLLFTGAERLRGTDLSSFNDHRVLMALAVASSRATGESRLTYPNAYRVSYPTFLNQMNGIGLNLSVNRSGTPSSGRLAAVPVTDLVRRHASSRPGQEAVLEASSPGRTGGMLTWATLDRQADLAASLLLELGVESGEVVAWQLPNWSEFVVLALACARIGAVACPLMPFFREREMDHLLRISRARVLVIAAWWRGRDYVIETAAVRSVPKHVLVVGSTGDLPPGWQRYEEAMDRQQPVMTTLAARRPAASDLAQLLFTSGTSGEPKGVLHRGDTLTRAAAMQARHLGLTVGDRLFIPSPLAHQTGFLYGMWLSFVLGAPMVLQPVWDGAEALAILHRTGATFVQAATPFLADLVSAVEDGGDPPPALRTFVASGATVPRMLAERATRTLRAAVCGAWGSTESCLGTLSAPTDEPARAWGTDGRALAGTRIRVTDDAGVVLSAGAEGNLEVGSDCLFVGYLDRPEWTAAALTPDGWYRSGDLAVIDDAGFVRMTGRVRDVINRGGEKIPVADVEQLLHTHPVVTDVAIVAMPDERLGERACAFVVADGVLTLAGMRAFLDDHKVAKQYWPERLVLLGDMPRNVVGKVQKVTLRNQIATIIEQENQ
jgi:cyclohexanecarboxylate-CoA ligase